MSQVTECAKALGEAIVASQEYRNMQITENEAMHDPEVAQAMSRYMEAKEELDSAMRQPEHDPQEIARLGQLTDDYQQMLNAMPAVDAMTQSRQQFSEMMNQVNRVLEFIITGEVEQSGGCSGNCGSCGGCH